MSDFQDDERRLGAYAAWATLGGCVGFVLVLLGEAIHGVMFRRTGWADLAIAVTFGVPAGSVAGLALAWWRYRPASPSDSIAERLRDLIYTERVLRTKNVLMPGATQIDVRFRALVYDAQEPYGRRLARHTTVRYHRLAQYFDQRSRRMVVLGAPGSGKTIAAMAILEAFNAPQAATGAPVVEIFNLGTWPGWRLSNPSGQLRDWMADQLVAQWGLRPQNALRLVNQDGMLLPIFDGLDEVEAGVRSDCVRAINVYLGATPSRPFLVCCRVREYLDLSPDWVASQSGAEILAEPLDVPQILERFDTLGFAKTGRLRALVSARAPGLVPTPLSALSDPNTCESPALFATPLRLGLAVRAFRDNSDAITDLDPARITATLWDRYLEATFGTGSPWAPDDARRWLGNLARFMTRNLDGAPVFWLHWLHLWDPVKRFTRQTPVGAAVGTLGGLASAGIFVSLGYNAVAVGGRQFSAVGTLLVGATFGGLAGVMMSPQPMFRRRSLRASPLNTSAALAIFAGGLIAAAAGGGLEYAMSGAWMAIATFVVFGFVSLVDDAARERLGLRSPYALLRESTVAGVMVGAVAAPLLGAAGVLRGMTTKECVAYGVGAFLIASLFGGVDAIVYHVLLRVRLAATGKFPIRLVRFFNWCAADERGWLRRVGGSYRFLHQELLDHLAAEAD